MKYLKHIIFGTLLVAVLVSIFVPLISVSNTQILTFQLIFTKNFNIISVILLITYCLVIGVNIALYFNYSNSIIKTISLLTNITAGFIFVLFSEIYKSLLETSSNVSFGNIFIGVILFLFSIYLLSEIFKTNRYTIKDIVESAMLIAFALVLDIAIFKIKLTLTGGSISFIMIPLLILSLRQGFVKGFISCGIVYGILACIFDNYGFFTYPFDYLLGFGLLAFVGIFKNIILPKDSNKLTIKGVIFLVVGVVVAIGLRLLASTISGMVFYGLDFWGSFVYQITYIGPSLAISLAAMLLLYKPLLLINRLF